MEIEIFILDKNTIKLMDSNFINNNIIKNDEFLCIS